MMIPIQAPIPIALDFPLGIVPALAMLILLLIATIGILWAAIDTPPVAADARPRRADSPRRSHPVPTRLPHDRAAAA